MIHTQWQCQPSLASCNPMRSIRVVKSHASGNDVLDLVIRDLPHSAVGSFGSPGASGSEGFSSIVSGGRV